MKRVVSIAFIKENKLLVVKSVRSSRNNVYTCVGGSVKKGEQCINAAIRECQEEIGHGFTIHKSDLHPLLCFRDKAVSDPRRMIELTIYLSSKEIDIPLIPNHEILDFHWYQLGDKDINVTSAISDHLVPYAIDKKLLY